MSLINQVLRDLDKRHANGMAVPAAVKAPVAGVRGGARWRVATLAAASLLAVGATAGAVAWTLGARSVPSAAPIAAAPPIAPPPAPAPAPTPVVVVAAVAPPAASAPLPVAAIEPAAPASAISLRDAWPARTLAAAPPAMIDTTPVAASSPRPAAPVGEPRIEKRAPARTAQERAEAEYQRGVAAHQQAQGQEAVAAYTAALRELPRFATARQALAAVLVGQGRADEAMQLLADGLALSPRHAGLALMLARLHVERGALAQAADVLQQAAAESAAPEDRAFHAAVLQRLNRHAEAAELFAAAVRVTPTNGVWWMGLGISLAADGRHDTAREAFNRARSSGSLSPELTAYVEQRLRQLL